MPATADRASVASYAQFPAELDRDWLGRVCHLSGADLAVIRRRTDPVTQLAVGALPDGTPVIISGGRDGTVRVWRLADGTSAAHASTAMLMARNGHKLTPSLVRTPRCDADSVVTMSHASTSGQRPWCGHWPLRTANIRRARQPDIWYITPITSSYWRGGSHGADERRSSIPV
jgi:WD40 repeat protein